MTFFISRSWRSILNTTLCDKVCQWLAADRWYSPTINCWNTLKNNIDFLYVQNISNRGRDHSAPPPSNFRTKKLNGRSLRPRTWWRLFWAYLMKVILSVPDEGYFERTWWRLFWAYMMKVILSVHDEGYFERTWWRLFWAYLMKVILSVQSGTLKITFIRYAQNNLH
jgi:hypothetical protein